jgi:hypothetical protein
MLFKTALDGTLFHSIVESAAFHLLQQQGTPQPDEAALWRAYLASLAQVPRFSIAVMMMERGDKTRLRDVFSALHSAAPPAERAAVAQLADKYEINL